MDQKSLTISIEVKNEDHLIRIKEEATRLVELLREAQNIIESLRPKCL